MNRFTEGLAVDLAGAGSPVRVQALCPGYTVTGFHDVTGFDRRRVPGWLWMTAGQVVDASLAGLASGSLYAIPGRRYRVLAFLLRWMPRPLRDRIASRFKARRPEGAV